MESPLVFQAIEFAAQKHRGQFRKGTKLPYIIHPLNVGRTLIEAGCDDEVVAAGILHDVLEDTGTQAGELETHFGQRVRQIVEWESEDKSLPWRARKETTIARIQGEAPLEVVLVACADKLDNIRAIRADFEAIGDRVWERFNQDCNGFSSVRDKQAWYYRGLALAFQSRQLCGMGEREISAFCAEVAAMFGEA